MRHIPGMQKKDVGKVRSSGRTPAVMRRRLLLLIGCCLPLGMFISIIRNREHNIPECRWGNIQLLNIPPQDRGGFNRPPPSLAEFKKLLDSLNSSPGAATARDTLLNGREGLVDSFWLVWELYDNNKNQLQ